MTASVMLIRWSTMHGSRSARVLLGADGTLRKLSSTATASNATSTAPFGAGHIQSSLLLPHGFAFLILLGVALFFVTVMQRLRRATALIRPLGP